MNIFPSNIDYISTSAAKSSTDDRCPTGSPLDHAYDPFPLSSSSSFLPSSTLSSSSSSSSTTSLSSSSFSSSMSSVNFHPGTTTLGLRSKSMNSIKSPAIRKNIAVRSLSITPYSYINVLTLIFTYQSFHFLDERC